MTFDPDQCDIRPPAGEEITRLYRLLWDIFVLDRPVYEQLLAGTYRLSDWQWYTMFSGPQIVGNACLIPMVVWLNDRPVDLLGVGAVATVPAYRRRGVAKRLMRHLLTAIDSQRAPAALFTTMPAVYEPFGFQTVRQVYRGFHPGSARLSPDAGESRTIQKFDDRSFAAVKDCYANRYPHYDGTVARTDDYWLFYRLMFDHYPKPHLFLRGPPDRPAGYLRVELEDDRVLISELCGDPRATGMIEGMLRRAGDFAADHQRDLVSLALPREHGAWDVLQRSGVETFPEVGGYRETFMVRHPADRTLAGLDEMQWSLADKF